MKNFCPAFDSWDKPEGDIPPGYQEINCHLIFDIKMGENVCQKDRFVAGGHMTKTPATLTYAYVVSRDLVCITLTIVALNGIDIFPCDIQNVHLNADHREKIWTRAGLDFGSEAVMIMIVKMALYGLKSSGVAFCTHLEDTLNGIGFLSTKVDPDVWYRLAVKPNGFQQHEYILSYVENILCISHGPGIELRQIQAVFKFKGDKMEQPEIYLGGQFGKMIVDGSEGWYISVENYVIANVENIE